MSLARPRVTTSGDAPALLRIEWKRDGWPCCPEGSAFGERRTDARWSGETAELLPSFARAMAAWSAFVDVSVNGRSDIVS